LPLLFKTLGDHLQIHLAQRASVEANKPFFITTKDRIAIATCFEIDTPCVFQSKLIFTPNFENDTLLYDDSQEGDESQEDTKTPAYVYLGNILTSKELDANDVLFLFKDNEFRENINHILLNANRKRSLTQIENDLPTTADYPNPNLEIVQLKNYLTDTIASRPHAGDLMNRIKARAESLGRGGVHQYLHICRLLEYVLQKVKNQGSLIQTGISKRLLNANQGGYQEFASELYLNQKLDFESHFLEYIIVRTSRATSRAGSDDIKMKILNEPIENYMASVNARFGVNNLNELQKDVDEWDSSPFIIICRYACELYNQKFIDKTIIRYIHNVLEGRYNEDIKVIGHIKKLYEKFKVFIKRKNEFIQDKTKISNLMNTNTITQLKNLEIFWIMLISLNNVFKPWFDMQNNILNF